MSKKKLLIHEVFRKAEEETGKKTKNGLAAYLWAYFDERFPDYITDKTLSRYYDTFIRDNGDRNIDTDTLDKFSEYVGYKNFADFSRTFIKKDDDANKTTVKISVDKDEESISELLSNIIINITNEQNFKMPEFMKKNGMGIMEMALVVCLVTGSVIFSHPKNKTYGFAGILPSMECMYWDGSEYKMVDCNDKNPLFDHKIPVDKVELQFFKRILRKDTLTYENAIGKTWYSKYNGEVEFFTKDGTDPDTGRELRKSTPLMLEKYAFQQSDSIEVE
ncbi:hypothetical protein A0O34_09815 [Chryseobacterium glaciei]|uniref:Uncharacterized protein n=1 Tax=Chryseobacterium glaciei TaxID=1685010 RepID=A0A172XUV9_9FLAO|nr:hypothetical protein [Chryseobacterium glaciei]ANF50799.1 hypothetical protein A0O34_09815 [Chryseobacterium glaciei]